MRNSKWLALLLSLVMALSVVLPGFAEDTSADDPVLVVVNGESILKSRVDRMSDAIINYYAQYGYDLSAEDYQDLVRQMAMESTLQDVFVHQLAENLGIASLSEEELKELAAAVDAEYEELIEEILLYYGLTPADDASEDEKATARESAVAIADSMGYTVEAFYENELENLTYERLTAELTKDITISDEDIAAEFQTLVEEDQETYADDPAYYEMTTEYYGEDVYYVPEGFRGVTHILLQVDSDLLSTYQDLSSRLEEQTQAEESEEADETADPVTQEDVDQARAAILEAVQSTLDEIYQKLDSGVSFEDLIREYGEDPGMEDAQTLQDGYSVSLDSIIYDPVFVQAAFSVDSIGEISDPYISSFGVHLVQYVRDVPAGPVDLTDDLRAELHDQLLAAKESEAFQAAYTEWENAAVIEYTEAGENYRPEPLDTVDEAQAIDSDDVQEADGEE
ncbi:MAG: peptidylprolyl isomerase [Clostridia bacterium]|nr:peptidylprolyl isomerase [Clostridia bacterium]